MINCGILIAQSLFLQARAPQHPPNTSLPAPADQNHTPSAVLDGKLEPIPRKIPRKEPLRILRPLGPRTNTRRVRRGGGINPAAQEVSVDALLQGEQGLGRADAEARVARCVGRDAVVVVFWQGDVDLLARGADVEPGELVGLRRGHGAGGQAQGGGVEGLGLVEGAFRDCQVDVVKACDEWLCRWLGVGGGHDCWLLLLMRGSGLDGAIWLLVMSRGAAEIWTNVVR